MTNPFLRLRCDLQIAPYGKKGSSSIAAHYATATPENEFTIDENVNYGEIWFGDHPKHPSRTLNGTLLANLVEADVDGFLTNAVYERFKDLHGKHIPFLFKILSFDKALPLQAHPHRKPEVAVTLSDTFDGFLGFRPVGEVKSFLKHVPELRKVLSDHETMKAAMDQLLTHVERGTADEALGELGKREGFRHAVEKCLRDWPNDTGVFAALFFCNFVRRSKAQGIVVPKDCIHAYLEGDVVECMARNDYMIACGLSGPEDRDSPEEFASELDFSPKPATSFDMKHDKWERSESGKTKIYYSPWDEFDLLYTKLGNGEKDKTSKGVMGPTIFVVTEGEVLMKHSDRLQEERLKKGQVVFVKPGHGWEWEAAQDGAEIWGAFVEGA
ncbi:RmlC-like cupin domain-containing protein [Pyronema omphalodes]|nr:RmlC-like cupin domain-containing protein [Pyronema omphalodes]